jgi:CheY-like chemotaxis protein
MSDNVTIELVRLVPSVLWAAVSLVAVFLFQRSIRNDLLPRLSKFKALGVEASFVKKALDRVSETVPSGDEQSRSVLARRAERLSTIIASSSVLLVNDIPEQMELVVNLLRSLKLRVTIATTTDKALDFLKRKSFDVVISDMSRDGVADEGTKFLKQSVDLGISVPTIFTVGTYDPSRGTPAYAFAITNRVDDMIHYVFDIIERSRGSQVHSFVILKGGTCLAKVHAGFYRPSEDLDFSISMPTESARSARIGKWSK